MTESGVIGLPAVKLQALVRIDPASFAALVLLIASSLHQRRWSCHYCTDVSKTIFFRLLFIK